MKKMKKLKRLALALAVLLAVPQGSLCTAAAAAAAEQPFSLRAAGAELTASSSRVSVKADGTPSPATIRINTNGTGGFRAETNRNWLRIGRTTNKYSYDELGYANGGLTFIVNYTDSGMFYIIPEENTSSQSRTATIKVTHENGIKSTTITVTQAAAGSAAPASEEPDGSDEVSLSADQSELTADASGTLSVKSVAVDTSGTGGFTAESSDSSWLKVSTSSSSSRASGRVSFTASGRVYVFVTANDSLTSRSGTITLSHAKGSKSITLNVTQEAAKAELSTDVTELTADASGKLSKTSIKADTNKTGGFTAESSDSSWLKVNTRNSSYSASGRAVFTGSGNVYVFAAANNTTESRSGTITLTHEKSGESVTISVTQEGAKTDLSPDVTELTADASGKFSKSYVRVNTNGTGGFKAEVSGASWLKINTRSSSYSASSSVTSSGSGSIYVFAQENKTKSSRSGTITLTHEKGGESVRVTVTQEAAKEELKVSASEIKADEKGSLSPSSVQVDTNGTGGFTAEVSGASWLKVNTKSSKTSASSRVSYTAGGRLYIFADANSELTERTGTITIKHSGGSETVSVQVVQSAGKAELTAGISETSANAKGVLTTSSVQVNTNKTGGFTAEASDSWIKVGKKSSKSSASSKETFTDSGRLYIFVDENKGAQRSGTITLTHEKGVKEVKITVTQEALQAILTIDSQKKTADKDGSFYSNAVSVKTQKTGSYTVEVKDAEWLKISSRNTKDFSEGFSKLDFTSDGKFYLLALPNEGEKRTAEVTISHSAGSLEKKVTVTQIGSESAYLEIDRETAYFDDPAAAVSGAVHVMAEDDTKWTVSVSASWIKVAQSSSGSAKKNASLEGEGSGTFYIWVTENGTFKDRSGYVTVAAPGMEEHQIYVSQEKNERDLTTLLEELTVKVNQKTFKKGKTTKIKLVYPEGLYASDVAKIGYASTKKKVATVNKNGTIKGIRKGKAVIKVRVVLDNGADKWFNLKVTVGTRKVSVVKQN